jgi:hypothetical protein
MDLVAEDILYEEVMTMDIPLNAEVHCTDGVCGRSTYVIVNPVNEQVTHVVVREAWFPHA